ncbi:hypothetical protein DFH27DRAFT_322488 [Peziza echinospora]|nr:hypothetical protein DFH27DRAFT_322488 [Peziza echinospora]
MRALSMDRRYDGKGSRCRTLYLLLTLSLILAFTTSFAHSTPNNHHNNNRNVDSSPYGPSSSSSAFKFNLLRPRADEPPPEKVPDVVVLPTKCGFPGDSDTYGLGIRIGIYTQWASGIVANWYVVEMAAVMRIRATLFQMAMAIALAFITVRRPRPHAVDAVIMIVILLGNSCGLTSHVIRPRQWKDTTLGGKMRFLFYFLLCLYATWFWWAGMENFQALPPQAAHCSGKQYGFFMYKVNLFRNWYRKVNFAFAVAGTSIMGTIFVGFIQRYWRIIWNEFYAQFKDQTSGEFGGLMADLESGGDAGAAGGGEIAPAPGPDPAAGGGGAGAGGEPFAFATGAKELGKSKDKTSEGHIPRWKPATAFGVMMLFIISVELLISWNDIDGVNTVLSTGQLIPMVIGIAGFLKILFRWWQIATVKKVIVKEKGGA